MRRWSHGASAGGVDAGDDGGPAIRPWHAVWAKTGRDERGSVTEWLPLHQHLADAEGVASRLADHWLAPRVLRRIGAGLPDGADGAVTLFRWLAAVHDVGKASPAFVVQDARLADLADRHGLPVDPRLARDPLRSAVSHGLVGQVAIRQWLTVELDFSGNAATALASVVGSHHGVPAESGQLVTVMSHQRLVGRRTWKEARGEALAWATDLVGGPEVLRRYAEAQLSVPAQVLLSGAVIVADWIASGFPQHAIHTAAEPLALPDPEVTRTRVARGWRALRFPGRWIPSDRDDDADSLVRRRFGRDAPARPVQRAALDAARTDEPVGLMIIEAPMGEGKTEAALLAVEAFAARSGAQGCFVALPTRATSDAMFARVRNWVQALPDRDGDVALSLAHGTATLNDDFAALLAAATPRSVAEDTDDDGAVLAHRWFLSPKRRVLAPFTVGTIDQVLFAGLKSRHVMLRHLGLTSKVVVIDEVHAYDVFMSQYLLRVLEWLGAHGVPVVLLSATLPAERRAALLTAYENGRGRAGPGPTPVGYPAVTTAVGSVTTTASRPELPVRLTRLEDDLCALGALLSDRLRDGGCAVVVRNTVARVQETADHLSALFGADSITVDHSRFLACDRVRIDLGLLRRFGPPGAHADRPQRHVVVASQVVEQSLDVDFDLMVTDLPPTDLLLQRMGRLHRHPRTRPAPLTAPECVLVGVEAWDAAPVRAVPGSRRVYDEHTLLRAAALVHNRAEVALPSDIPGLVDRAYGSDLPSPPGWEKAMADAAQLHVATETRRSEAADAFRLDPPLASASSLVGWLRAGVGEAEDDPRRSGQVRDGDDSLEVLVVCRDGAGGLLTPDWIERGAALAVPVDFAPDDDLAKIVAACAVRFPPALSHPGVIDAVIAELERRHHVPGFQLHGLLKGQLVLQLDPDRTAELGTGRRCIRLTYDPQRGLLHEQL